MTRPSALRVVVALLLATAFSALFATGVFVDLNGARVRARDLPASPQGGTVRVTAGGGRSRELIGSLAVIVHVQNGSSRPQHFAIAVDGEQACQAEIAANRTRRIDCATRSTVSAESHDVTVTGPPGDWTLEYVELATHHGRSSGVLTAFILPRESTHYERPAIGWTIPVWLGLTFLFAIPFTPWPSASRFERVASRAIAALVVVVFGVALASPMVSPYRVVVSLGTFVGWIVIALAARTWVFLGPDRRTYLRRAVATTTGRTFAMLAASNRFVGTRAGFLQALGVGLVVGWVFYSFASDLTNRRYHHNPSGLVHISRRFFDGNPLVRDRADVRSAVEFADGIGYDGQYFYHMAFDPFLRAFHDEPGRYRSFIDTPPYRYGRIGFSLLTKILSGDRPVLYPVVMVTLVVVAMAACGALLAAVARQRGLSVWYGALVMLVPGYWSAVSVSLPEPLAAAFFLGGYLCLIRRTAWAAGLLFGLSLLVRETGGAFVVALVVATFLRERRREALTIGLIAFVPIVAWKLYVGWSFLPDWGLEAFTHHPDDLGAPLAGILQLWSLMAKGVYFDGSSDMNRAGLFFPPLVIAGAALAAVAAFKRPGPITAAGSAYALLAMLFNYSSVWLEIGNAQRLTVDLFLALALTFIVIPRTSRFLWTAFAGFWAASGLYLLFGTYNVVETHRALLFWP